VRHEILSAKAAVLIGLGRSRKIVLMRQLKVQLDDQKDAIIAIKRAM